GRTPPRAQPPHTGKLARTERQDPLRRRPVGPIHRLPRARCARVHRQPPRRRGRPMSTTTSRTVVLLDDDTFWAAQSSRDHLFTSSGPGASADAHRGSHARAARRASGAGVVMAVAAVVAAAALAIGEVRR